MDYMHFTFDGLSSKYFNLIVQNNGQDLSYPSQPSFDNQIVSPLYQGASYLAGVNKKDRVFNFNCWIDSISMKTLREIQNWLSLDKTGYLILDYNTNFKYKVKISSFSDLKHFAINQDGTSNYEFSLSFITIGDFAATSNNKYSSLNGNNPDGFLRGVEDLDNNILYFYNTYNLPFYLDFGINSTTSFLIKKDDVTHFNYDRAGLYKIDGKTGFCLDLDDNKLIEELLEDNAEYTNLGAMMIPSDIKQIYAEVIDDELTFEDIFNDTTVRIYVSGNNTFYTSLNYNDIISDFNLKEGDIIILNYLKPTKIYISSFDDITYSFEYRDNL